MASYPVTVIAKYMVLPNRNCDRSESCAFREVGSEHSYQKHHIKLFLDRRFLEYRIILQDQGRIQILLDAQYLIKIAHPCDNEQKIN